MNDLCKKYVKSSAKSVHFIKNGLSLLVQNFIPTLGLCCSQRGTESVPAWEQNINGLITVDNVG